MKTGTVCLNLITFSSCTLDIDECLSDSSPCSENALCTNNDGSYSCNCKQGFTGNGTVCEGMSQGWNESKSSV